MNIKTLASALVLSTSMLVGAPAFAATMVGSMSVSDTDLPAVQQRCDQLALAQSNESLTETSSATSDKGAATADSGTTEGDSSAGAADAGTASTEQVNEAANATTQTIDLDTVTIEQCRTAGLVTAQ